MTITVYRLGFIAAGLAALVSMTGCRTLSVNSDIARTLEPVAFSDRQWTGIAVSRDKRIFVNYPRWSDNVPLSVAELVDGKPVPYPSQSLNEWTRDKDPSSHFVCVQAMYIDDLQRLWILDPANPKFQGVVPGGPKLLQVDLGTDRVVRTISFPPDVAGPSSYLNDLRVDVKRDMAYLTDSGDGALLVLDLNTGRARRVLDDHPSAHSEDILLTIGGEPWLINGNKPQVHADGIAYDPNSDTVFFQALTGRTMYSINAAALRDASLDEQSLQQQVKTVGRTGSSDGLLLGPDGKIYISALERDAILRTTPTGDVETVVQSDAIAWPDSFSLGPDNQLYFTTARIHEGAEPRDRYGIYRISLED